MPSASNIYRLGIKEFWSLIRDPMMLALIAYSFTASIYVKATAAPESLHHAPVAIVDEDASPLSGRIASSFHPPYFNRPALVSLHEIDTGLDTGEYTFALDIPPNFQRDVLAGRAPAIQLNVDATRMSQALAGSGYIQQIVLSEVDEFVRRYRTTAAPAVDLALRARFNPTLDQIWFGSVMEVINQVTIVSILLAGAALIREREHGTIEHLLVMPVTPGEIMLGKVWAMGVVVLAATVISLSVVVQGFLRVTIEGSVALFLVFASAHLFATTSMGFLMATMVSSMPQFALLMLLTILPMQMLSGSMTPRESMPKMVQDLMLVAPTTHFVSAGQAILFRAAGFEIVWPQLLALLGIGAVCFTIALLRFRRTMGQM
jgi:ABC-2 type transport system permease protein